MKAQPNFGPLYPAFGSVMEGRSFVGDTSAWYRFGFNSKIKDDEVSGEGNCYDYGFRFYNSSLGKFLSVDPLMGSFPQLTPYQFAANMPIVAVDLDGLEAVIKINSITVSKAFIEIQSGKGIEEAMQFLEQFMNAKHSPEGLKWLQKVSGGKVSKDVIVVGNKTGFPETLVFYILEYNIEDNTAKFVEYRFHVPGEMVSDDRSILRKTWDKFVNWIAGDFSGEPETRKVRRADWFDRFLDKYVDYDALKTTKDIFGWDLEGSPNTVDFSEGSPYFPNHNELSTEEEIANPDTVILLKKPMYGWGGGYNSKDTILKKEDAEKFIKDNPEKVW